MWRSLICGARAALLALALAAPFTIDVPAVHADPGCTPRPECCKVCDKGKACGNSCISRAKNCHKGRGCACDADELCE
jgi:hypothetical protein